MKIKVFDFFSGCGGTSTGFAMAGMEVVFGLDNDPDAAATFRANVRGATFVESDIREVKVDVLAPLLRGKRYKTLFSCCAPCQPFSRQSRAKTKGDPRRSLLLEFSRFVRRWKPDYVFVENVPGLQRVDGRAGPLSDFTALLTRLGYSFDVKVVPALAFGVPQKRERLILMAAKAGNLEIPAATHGTSRRPVSTVRDWIGGLPELRAGATDPADPDHRAATLSPINLRRIAATPEGGGREGWPKSLRLDCHREFKGHTDVYGRLAWDRPAAGLTTRCISYSNGRFGHPTQDRAISVREAACLQTFPRKYRFSGILESKARQIGNAVPPLMAKAIGRAYVKHASDA
ncbi:DNA cytosine methyltransferase [Bradyrhizobium elkanii]|uniref:DNA cytosine methyltransferase n=1 Tax=Bradyrhizobium elkanii TaxID=29448 RepID=UPI0035154AB6